MVPVVPMAEPGNFDLLVRKPGEIFLKRSPNPKSSEWKEYWQESLPDMRLAYNKICAYSACWIPHGTGSHSIDHFQSKQEFPQLAYEWTNFRYVSTRFNSRKGVRRILDPFSLLQDSFIIDFSTFLIMPNSQILDEDAFEEANETIRILKLNDDDDLVRERQEYYEYYTSGEISLEYLVSKAPFIGYEVLRQKLTI